jgi:type I restriction enzyme R subunit
MIEEYNSGALSVEAFFAGLLTLARQLDDEEKRLIAENLSEEEMAVFDLLTKPEPDLSEDDKQAVKQVARELLDTLKREKLVLDWRKRQQTRAQVRTTIEKMLDAGLSATYTAELYETKCDAIYQHVYDAYFGQGKSIYAPAA